MPEEHSENIGAENSDKNDEIEESMFVEYSTLQKMLDMTQNFFKFLSTEWLFNELKDRRNKCIKHAAMNKGTRNNGCKRDFEGNENNRSQLLANDDDLNKFLRFYQNQNNQQSLNKIESNLSKILELEGHASTSKLEEQLHSKDDNDKNNSASGLHPIEGDKVEILKESESKAEEVEKSLKVYRPKVASGSSELRKILEMSSEDIHRRRSESEIQRNFFRNDTSVRPKSTNMSLRSKQFSQKKEDNFRKPQSQSRRDFSFSKSLTSIEFTDSKRDKVEKTKAPRKVKSNPYLSYNSVVILEGYVDGFKYPNFHPIDPVTSDGATNSINLAEPCSLTKSNSETFVFANHLSGGKMMVNSSKAASFPELFSTNHDTVYPLKPDPLPSLTSDTFYEFREAPSNSESDVTRTTIKASEVNSRNSSLDDVFITEPLNGAITSKIINAAEDILEASGSDHLQLHGKTDENPSRILQRTCIPTVIRDSRSSSDKCTKSLPLKRDNLHQRYVRLNSSRGEFRDKTSNSEVETTPAIPSQNIKNSDSYLDLIGNKSLETLNRDNRVKCIDATQDKIASNSEYLRLRVISDQESSVKLRNTFEPIAASNSERSSESSDKCTNESTVSL